ncbi:autotransporter outer membrane beta-barrel domain-containing protein [Helicobacter pametensis]|uniref:autotransporter outer membrane beta-barrel domain-containing protein n=1 Tax=Helicobacter pametensis TaxID=95149 RepID=UPI000480165A|nr:autotransporter outer membrane beta-barrel domain-containing protein [Helicobacter pametensis]
MKNFSPIVAISLSAAIASSAFADRFIWSYNGGNVHMQNRQDQKVGYKRFDDNVWLMRAYGVNDFKISGPGKFIFEGVSASGSATGFELNGADRSRNRVLVENGHLYLGDIHAIHGMATGIGMWNAQGEAYSGRFEIRSSGKPNANTPGALVYAKSVRADVVDARGYAFNGGNLLYLNHFGEMRFDSISSGHSAAYGIKGYAKGSHGSKLVLWSDLGGKWSAGEIRGKNGAYGIQADEVEIRFNYESPSSYWSRVNFDKILTTNGEAIGIDARNISIHSAHGNSEMVFYKINATNGAAYGLRGNDISIQANTHSPTRIVFEEVKGTYARGMLANKISLVTGGNGEITVGNVTSTGGGDHQDAVAFETRQELYLQGNINSRAVSATSTAKGILFAGSHVSGRLNWGTANFGGIFGDRNARGFEIYSGSGVQSANIVFDNSSRISFREIYAGSDAIGLSLHAQQITLSLNSGSRMDFDSIRSKGVASGIRIGHGSVTMNGGGTIRFGEIFGEWGSYGIQNSGTLNIENATLRFDRFSGSNITPIDNGGKIILGADASIIVGNGPSDHRYRYGIYNTINGAQFNLGNTTIATRGDDFTFAIGSKVDTTYKVGHGKTLELDVHQRNGAEKWAFTGDLGDKTYIVLENGGATLKFNGGAGKLHKLQGNWHSTVDLAGDLNRRTGNHNAQLRDLRIQNLDADKTNFIVYATGSRNIQTGHGFFDGRAYSSSSTRSTVGGSDRVFIGNAVKDNSQNNTLTVKLGDFAQKSGQYVVLAEVKGNAKDKITFNNLKSSDASANSRTSAGYAEANITIKRKDHGDTAYYYAELPTASNARIARGYIDESAAGQNAGAGLYFANINSLNKRMGELRDNPNDHGVWARVFTGEQISKFGSELKTQYTTVQAGYDYNFGTAESGARNHYLGFALSYANSKDTEVLNSSNNAKTQAIEAAVYFATVKDEGLYSDSIAKFAYMANDLNFAGDTSSNKVNNYALAFSQELGYRFKIADSFFLTPQIEETLSYISGSDFTREQTGNKTLKSTQDQTFMARTRVGLGATYQLSDAENQFKANFHLGAFYTYDYMNGGKITFKASDAATPDTVDVLESNGRFVLNLGTNFAVQDSTRLYFDFEKSFGDKLYTNYQVNVGVRYSFGEKAPKQP